MAKLLMFDVENGFCEVECNDIEDYQTLIGCNCFDIATRLVNGKQYDIYCDDEGLFKDNPVVTAVDGEGNGMLVGNLIFANHDEHGNTVDLTDEDKKWIMMCYTIVMDEKGRFYHVVHPVEFC